MAVWCTLTEQPAWSWLHLEREQRHEFEKAAIEKSEAIAKATRGGGSRRGR